MPRSGPCGSSAVLFLLQADPSSEVEELLLEAGILVRATDGPCFSLATYNRHFHDIVYVWRKTGPGVPDLCCCHAGCEHVVFT